MSSYLNLLLAPIPKQITYLEGNFISQSKKHIKLKTSNPHALLCAVKKTQLDWEVTLSPNVPNDQVGLIIEISDSFNISPEGYKLNINTDVIEIYASTPAGAFYGACTLSQIIRNITGSMENNGIDFQLPCLTINDWPDFPVRGVMHDITRDKVPTLETLYHLVDLLADWKINQLQLYIEHAYAYLAHPTVWEKASPITGEEVMKLDAYCKERFIELVPNQNSFGHLGRWLSNDKYRYLSECPDGFELKGRKYDFGNCLNPISEECIDFLSGLYDEFLPNFTSNMFNVGCDETEEIGFGKSKSACEEKGKGRVYFNFLMKIYKLVKERGKTMQFWGDIIMHHPELIPELPKDIIALEWGYEMHHPYEEHATKFAESGISFYVCPGTSTWNGISGRTENAICNITKAATVGLIKGAIGLLNTDWGDSGHWQTLSVSYLGFLVGAMASWNTNSDIRANLRENLSLNAFGDATGKMGRAFYELGDNYRCYKRKTGNGNVPWLALFRAYEDTSFIETEISECDDAKLKLKDIAFDVIGEQMTCPDAQIIREEFIHIFNLLDLAADFMKKKLGGPKPYQMAKKVEEIKKRHEKVWLMRNRIGGLSDSLGCLRLSEEDLE